MSEQDQDQKSGLIEQGCGGRVQVGGSWEKWSAGALAREGGYLEEGRGLGGRDCRRRANLGGLERDEGELWDDGVGVPVAGHGRSDDSYRRSNLQPLLGGSKGRPAGEDGQEGTQDEQACGLPLGEGEEDGEGGKLHVTEHATYVLTWGRGGAHEQPRTQLANQETQQ